MMRKHAHKHRHLMSSLVLEANKHYFVHPIELQSGSYIQENLFISESNLV